MSTYQTVMTVAIANANRAKVNQRLLELLHYQKNRLAYRKRTEIAVEMVEQIESEHLFPEANDAFDNGGKRLVIVQETEDLSDAPRFLLSDARHWEATRIIQTWLYRWPIEVFHEFCKQVTGLESAQLRNEDAVKRHFTLSCVAQSILQSVTGCGEKSERFSFIKQTQSIGQKVY